MKRCLLDTGAVIASFDAADAEHGRVVRWLESFRGEFITTGAVITEAFYYLGPEVDAVNALVEFLLQSGLRRLDCFTPEAMHRAATLMRKYVDTPMDFTDASLVWAAEETQTGEILTLDQRGFRTFRYARNRSFRLSLQDG